MRVPLWMGVVAIVVVIVAAVVIEIFREAWRRDAHDKKMDLLRAEAFSSTASGRGLREIPDPTGAGSTWSPPNKSSRKGEIQ